MKETKEIEFDNLVLSCAFEKYRTQEEFVPSKLKAFLFDFNKPYKIDIEKFMMQNFKFNVPLTQFARLTGRSVAAFKRDFKSAFSQSPRQWMQQKRLSEAYRLIKEKRQKPIDIYLDLGFENLSHFYYSFKKKYGVTPSELGG